MLSSGSRRSLPSAFQTVGPTTANARRPYVSSCILGTTSRRQLAERRCCRSATWATGLHRVWWCAVKTAHHHTELEHDPICHSEPVQLSMTELSQTAVVPDSECPRQRSSQTAVVCPCAARTAAFMTCCNWRLFAGRHSAISRHTLRCWVSSAASRCVSWLTQSKRRSQSPF